MPRPPCPLHDNDHEWPQRHTAARGCLAGLCGTVLLFGLLLLGVYAFAAPGPLPACTGLVTHVHDGDTLTGLCGAARLQVRVAGIDAPELSQPYGHQAQNRAAALVLGRPVTIGTGHLDRYGRRVAVVTLADGRSLGLVLVQEGWAFWYRQYAPHASDLRDAEQAAHQRRLGLWQDPAPIAPWGWRKGVR